METLRVSESSLARCRHVECASSRLVTNNPRQFVPMPLPFIISSVAPSSAMWTPDRSAHGVHGQRDLLDLRAQLRESVGALSNLRIDFALRVRMAETLGHDADAEPSRVLPKS